MMMHTLYAAILLEELCSKTLKQLLLNSCFHRDVLKGIDCLAVPLTLT